MMISMAGVASPEEVEIHTRKTLDQCLRTPSLQPCRVVKGNGLLVYGSTSKIRKCYKYIYCTYCTVCIYVICIGNYPYLVISIGHLLDPRILFTYVTDYESYQILYIIILAKK